MVVETRASVILYNYLLSNHNGGGYWLVPMNSCPVVPMTFASSGIPFKLVDIENKTYCMDGELIIKSLIDPNCEGMIFINSYGIQASFEELFSTVKRLRTDFKIIEDKCLNPPEFGKSGISSFSDLTLYSTGYSKFVDLGFGGFGFLGENSSYKKHDTDYSIAAEDEIEIQYRECLKESRKVNNKGTGWIDNRNMSRTQIADYKNRVLRQKKAVTNHKKEINRIYENLIPKQYWLNPGALDNAWRFNLYVPDKQKVLNMIFQEGLFAGDHYQPVDQIFDVEVIGSGRNAYNLYAGVINLFNDKNFTAQMAEKVCNLLSEHYKSKEEAHVHSI